MISRIYILYALSYLYESHVLPKLVSITIIYLFLLSIFQLEELYHLQKHALGYWLLDMFTTHIQDQGNMIRAQSWHAVQSYNYREIVYGLTLWFYQIWKLLNCFLSYTVLNLFLSLQSSPFRWFMALYYIQFKLSYFALYYLQF